MLILSTASVSSVFASNFASTTTATTFTSTSMTQDKMENIVVNEVEVLEQRKGYIVFNYQKVKMALISDVKYDRMRIIAPITEYPKLSVDKKDAALESNFHSALDARYAVSNGIIYSAYIHPLSDLSSEELMSALKQVSTLALTFGSSYSSGQLNFGGNKSKTNTPKNQPRK
jgi:hypothetical protein